QHFNLINVVVECTEHLLQGRGGDNRCQFTLSCHQITLRQPVPVSSCQVDGAIDHLPVYAGKHRTGAVITGSNDCLCHGLLKVSGANLVEQGGFLLNGGQLRKFIGYNPVDDG